LASCQGNIDEQIQVNEELAKCMSEKPLTVPKSLKIKELGKIDVSGSVYDFQFIDNKIGYVLASQNFGGYVNIFKTEDGGNTWRNLDVKINYNPINFHFIDSDNGFFSIYDSFGCPNNCQNRCVLYITKNGGQTWERKEYSNLKGYLYYLTSDDKKNLYATLSSLNQKRILVKSIDKGMTWDTLYTSDNLHLSSIKFGLKIYNNNLYALAKGGNILRLTTKGELLKTIKTNQIDVYDLEIAAKDTLLIKGHMGLHKSNNEGETWSIIEEKRGELVNFISGNEGLVIKNINSCQTDTGGSNDVFAYTKDGGITWENSSEYFSLSYRFVNSQIVNDKYYIFLNKTLYILEKN
jgi:photosystem II stability/assembly factor-like uncharacterized protein